jgi:hypothetical protein
MLRLTLPAVLLLAALPPALRADAFDHYINTVLARAPDSPAVKRLERLTAAELADHDGVLPNVPGVVLIVRTNENRFSKLLVQRARQKIGQGSLAILLVERFVTYREGEEKTVLAEGKNVRLFHDFRFSLDLGQVVPEAAGGDLRFVATEDRFQVEPVGKAELFVLTKPMPEATPKKAAKLEIGAAFEPRYFNGRYKIYDDGRRSGTLVLQVGEGSEVTGSYYSDKDGQKYEVTGKIGSPPHSIQFTVALPRTSQVFQGWLFTGDGRALVGSSRLQERETGFYALRE